MRAKVILIIGWFLFVTLLKELNIFSFPLETIIDLVVNNKEIAYLTFLTLWVVRLFLFIPGTAIVLLGSTCFHPLENLLISTIGQIISATIIYFIAKSFFGSYINKQMNEKYPMINQLIVNYQYKLLALGLICPIAPTDAICFLSASVGFKFKPYIVTVTLASIPIRLLYSYVGVGFTSSPVFLALLIVTFLLMAFFTIRLWNKLKQRVEWGI